MCRNGLGILVGLLVLSQNLPIFGYKIDKNAIVLRNKLVNFNLNRKFRRISSRVNPLTTVNNVKNVLGVELPNTLTLRTKLTKCFPVLSVDFGSTVGLSFNYLNEFELFKPVKFTNYPQLTKDIKRIINHVKRKYVISSLIVLFGFPYNIGHFSHNNFSHHTLSHGNISGDAVSTDLRLLFQILFTLDFSSYFAHCNCVSPGDTGDIVTKCVYCSLFPGEACVSGRDCSTNVNLEDYLNSDIVLGTSEHYTTFQNSHINNSINSINTINTIDSVNSVDNVFEKDVMSSLNIYENLVSGGGFVVLPNGNCVFNGTRSNNNLLYQHIKHKLTQSNPHYYISHYITQYTILHY